MRTLLETRARSPRNDWQHDDVGMLQMLQKSVRFDTCLLLLLLLLLLLFAYGSVL
jgi:hypothetical protein